MISVITGFKVISAFVEQGCQCAHPRPTQLTEASKQKQPMDAGPARSHSRHSQLTAFSLFAFPWPHLHLCAWLSKSTWKPRYNQRNRDYSPSVRWLIFIINLVVFRITIETQTYLEVFNWGKESLNAGGTYPRLTKTEKEAEYQHSSLPTSWQQAQAQCDPLPHAPASTTSPPWWIAFSNCNPK